MADNKRTQRIGDQIRKELGRILLQEAKDQRLKLIALTDVHVTRDLGYAKVFYTLIDAEQDRAEIAKTLEKAAPFMRSRIAEELHLRVTPKLRFVYDDSMEYGRHMSTLIDTALSKHTPADSDGESGSESEEN